MYKQPTIIVFIFVVFISTITCENICDQPEKPGSCFASFVRWYYDPRVKDCKRFTYGGCEGNENNFLSYADCEKICGKNICNQPMVQGNCKASIEKWYYEPKANDCKNFTYGGCDGNKNNFQSYADCEKKCVKNTCNQPMVTGKCDAIIERWYYEPKANDCTKFTYGGCGGNENNFLDYPDCKKQCVKK